MFATAPTSVVVGGTAARRATARAAVEARAVAVGATLLRAAVLLPASLPPSQRARGVPLQKAWITWLPLRPVVRS